MKADKSVKNAQGDTSSNFVNPAADAAQELRELFINCLKDIYWAENALLKALPKMRDNASAAKLSSVIKDHIRVTEMQISRLDEVFDMLGEKAAGKKCEALAGLIAEGASILEETAAGPVRDAGIIAASQKIEHYEIATYGTLVAFAKTLGENDVAKLLQQTLAEEKEADCLLNDAAYNAINFRASGQSQLETAGERGPLNNKVV